MFLQSGETALHVAARYGHAAVVDFLCESKANINLIDSVSTFANFVFVSLVMCRWSGRLCVAFALICSFSFFVSICVLLSFFSFFLSFFLSSFLLSTNAFFPSLCLSFLRSCQSVSHLFIFLFILLSFLPFSLPSLFDCLFVCLFFNSFTFSFFLFFYLSGCCSFHLSYLIWTMCSKALQPVPDSLTTLRISFWK